MTVPPVLVIAVGNPSRGDDALAPLLLRRLENEVAACGRQEEIELLEDFQLQVEHAADMRGRELVLFLDAGANTPAPYYFQRIQAHAGRPLLSHALPPEDVLAAYLQVFLEPAPPSFLLCISGAQFGLGEPLSAQAGRHLDSAFECAAGLLRTADLAAWEARARAPAGAL